jgi:hypothetical protein
MNFKTISNKINKVIIAEAIAGAKINELVRVG